MSLNTCMNGTFIIQLVKQGVVGTGNKNKILETLTKLTTGKTSYYDNIRIFHISEKLTLKSPRTQVQNSVFYASIIRFPQTITKN